MKAVGVAAGRTILVLAALALVAFAVLLARWTFAPGAAFFRIRGAWLAYRRIFARFGGDKRFCIDDGLIAGTWDIG